MVAEKKKKQSSQYQQSSLQEKNRLLSNADCAEFMTTLIQKRDRLNHLLSDSSHNAWAKLELREIKSAIERINGRTYGICVACDKQIFPERLRALPYTLNCLECQSEGEREQRRRGGLRSVYST